MGRTKGETPPATPTTAPPETDETKQTATEGQAAEPETNEKSVSTPEGAETPAASSSAPPETPLEIPETPAPEKKDKPAPEKRITFTLTGAGSFTGFGLARIAKNGTVEVDEETATHLRRTGLFEEG